MAWWKRRSSRDEASDGPAAPGQGPPLPLIRFDAVSRHFEGDADEPSIALEHVSVDIDRGEYVSVVGPSGCGKSTFLSVLALLDTPTAGRYWLMGRPTDRFTAAERARTRNVEIGIIFQSFNLLGDMTIAENVEYPLTLRGLSAAERQARVSNALERVGLSARARQRPGSLSGGHQQLVAIARAFAGRPPIILADEPTGNLDSTSGEAVMKMLEELNADGSTVCLATHDPRHMARTRRRIELLDGRLAPQAGA